MTERFVILGCGHTGTTLIGGILYMSGYGGYKASKEFERLVLNRITAHLLENSSSADWLASATDFFQRLEHRTKGRWAIKDPKLCDLLDELYPLIPKPVKVVFNYRNPRHTVSHLMKHRTTLSDQKALESAEEEWFRRNARVLQFLSDHPDVEHLIVNYDDLVDRKLVGVIDRFVGSRLNYSFISPTKRKSPPMEVSPQLIDLYQEISALYRHNLIELLLNTPAVREDSLLDRITTATWVWLRKGRRFTFRRERSWRTYPYDW